MSEGTERAGRTGHEIVTTREGALAVRSVGDGETMHPGVGPLVEAAALYAGQSRLAERLWDARGSFVLFDVGLGAASNALAARAVSEAAPARGARLTMVSFERDLGALELALAHGVAFGLDGEPGRAARELLDTGRSESARTSWQLRRGDLLEQLAALAGPSGAPLRADLVFWDPFSPKANPALWTVAAFAAMRRVAADGCTLFTYSASTAVRAALLLAGWTVGVGESIGSKAETTAAAVRVGDLARPLGAPWLRRVSLPGAPLPSDAPPDAIARIAAAPQFR